MSYERVAVFAQTSDEFEQYWRYTSAHRKYDDPKHIAWLAWQAGQKDLGREIFEFNKMRYLQYLNNQERQL